MRIMLFHVINICVLAKEGPIFPRAHGKIRQTFDSRVQDGSL